MSKPVRIVLIVLGTIAIIIILGGTAWFVAGGPR